MGTFVLLMKRGVDSGQKRLEMRAVGRRIISGGAVTFTVRVSNMAEIASLAASEADKPTSPANSSSERR
jgi:hypothetical protein